MKNSLENKIYNMRFKAYFDIPDELRTKENKNYTTFFMTFGKKKHNAYIFKRRLIKELIKNL